MTSPVPQRARGKRTSRAMLEVAEHYYLFDGGAIMPRIGPPAVIPSRHRVHLPVAGPGIDGTIRQVGGGVRRALAFVTSAFASPLPAISGGHQAARHRPAPGWKNGSSSTIRDSLSRPPIGRRAPVDRAGDRPVTRLLFTAHSLWHGRPLRPSNSREACRLVAERAGRGEWDLVYQSRSGPAEQAWLEPDIRDHLATLRGEAGCRHAVVAPIGFLSEHMEVIYDLDVEAAGLCQELGITMVRSAVVGCHPRFVAMIRELLQERLEDNPVRLALGNLGPSPDVCPGGCCPPR